MKNSKSAAVVWTHLIGALILVNGAAAQQPPAGPASEPTGFEAVYSPAQDKKYEDMRVGMTKNEPSMLRLLAALTNETYKIPTRAYLKMAQCGQPNASYDPSSKSITLCYEILEECESLFRKYYAKRSGDGFSEAMTSAFTDHKQQRGPKPTIEGDRRRGGSKATKTATGALAFIFFHELGHALIDILDLPVAGTKEEAVDQLSTLTLVNSIGSEYKQAAVGGALFFERLGREHPADSKAMMADEPPLDQQRYSDILCWVYGSDPEEWDFLATSKVLPKERALSCPGEYKKIEQRWEKILTPFANIESRRRANGGRLGDIRSALSLYHEEQKGVYPRKLDALVPKYLKTIPVVDMPPHKPTKAVRTLTKVADKKDLMDQLTDSGQWVYVADPQNRELFGTVLIDCTHTDERGMKYHVP